MNNANEMPDRAPKMQGQLSFPANDGHVDTLCRFLTFTQLLLHLTVHLHNTREQGKEKNQDASPSRRHMLHSI